MKTGIEHLSSESLWQRAVAAADTIRRSDICVKDLDAQMMEVVATGRPGDLNLLHVERLEEVVRTAQAVIDGRYRR